ncbi:MULTISPECIES: hypothetical protein [unclassified Luteimonas]|uniref:hypothetical protein n=1 Tax=unclassified Luteimonas TaxID=2629088 RepID=UPI0018F0A42A|nr:MULTISPECIES: hypothetical protein [unclassified Luteimonas]MBJ6978195.1 hypothetical protein [Luteimonas sp. MC1895]MBJ6984099.1 hypothetical protein [Luteimonas sp. MC1750]QQO06906.1 hypothetical protein JGR68_05645 [Luteimonas sp. MC1750]
MQPSRSMFRPALAVAIAATLVATAGCSWFRKDTAVYAAAPQDRPLEVPPDLDRPDTSSAMAVPATGTTSVTRSGMTAAAATPQASNGFTVSASRDETFGRIEPILAGIEGVTVVSKAQLLGTYDVDAGDSKFLVRVSQTDSGSYVSAVDPRGVAATGEHAVRVIEALRAALAQ